MVIDKTQQTNTNPVVICMKTYNTKFGVSVREREKNNKHAINAQLLLLFHMGKCANIPRYDIACYGGIVGIISTANVHRNCNITIYLLYNYGKLWMVE